MKEILNKVRRQFNFSDQCRRYNLSIWQCPQFLFVIMGIFTGAVIIISYFFGSRYLIDNPELLIIALSLIAIILLTISFIITQSFERLAEANNMKSDLISIISHQIRTPLTNMRWIYDMMSGDKSNFTKEQEYNLGMMKSNIKRMIKIASDLSIASQIERDTFSSKKEKYSLKEVVYQEIKEIKENESLISIKSEEGDIKNYGDEIYIKMVINNLLDNARRYGGDKIKVEIIKNKESEVVFKVWDNGVGIPKSDQSRIFQKFFRGSNALKFNTQGVGLNLFISKFIIEREGGSIGFESKEKKGTTFWFSLPVSPPKT